MPGQEQVVAVAHEAYRHPVDVELRPELQVLHVLVREGGDAEGRVGDVDALVVAQHAADHDLGLDGVALEADRPEAEATVVEQEDVAHLDVVHQTLVGDAHTLLITGAVVARGQIEARALLQCDLVLLEAAHADLGTLQVLQDADGDAELLGRGADVGNGLPVQLVVAVGEVEAEDVHPGQQQAADHLLGVRGGPQRGHDACAAGGYYLRRVHRCSAAFPRKRAASPSSCSICSSRLYLAVRSDRLADPVLIWPALMPTARSVMNVSSVSPERWLITLR